MENFVLLHMPIFGCMSVLVTIARYGVASKGAGRERREKSKGAREKI